MALLPMNASILPPSDDWVFKTILTSDDAKPALIDLLESVLGRKIDDLVVLSETTKYRRRAPMKRRFGWISTAKCQTEHRLILRCRHVISKKTPMESIGT